MREEVLYTLQDIFKSLKESKWKGKTKTKKNEKNSEKLRLRGKSQNDEIQENKLCIFYIESACVTLSWNFDEHLKSRNYSELLCSQNMISENMLS